MTPAWHSAPRATGLHVDFDKERAHSGIPFRSASALSGMERFQQSTPSSLWKLIPINPGT